MSMVNPFTAKRQFQKRGGQFDDAFLNPDFTSDISGFF